MNEHIFISLSVIIVVGIFSQWLAWRLKVPSILVLLLAGFISGPVTGFIRPDALFSQLLFPLVSISVAVILYEGGLTLRRSEIRSVGKVVRNLISIGLLVTWTLTTGAAYWIAGLPLSLSILLGAILVVTGPTVILPLLRSIRPGTRINSILKWEGMLNDPIGALLAVLVFESILASGYREITLLAVSGLLKMIVMGGGIGVLSGFLMMKLLQHRLIPDYLQNAASIGLVMLVFMLSNLVQHESGLFAVTVMGIFLANQRRVTVSHIIEFKENLRVLLLSTLFIILAARLSFADMQQLGWRSIVFVASLLVVIRPAAVWLSTLGTDTDWRERLFISWMAPRGIVAAAVASLFAMQLQEVGVAGAEKLVPLTFMVIVTTIICYGLSGAKVAQALGITGNAPRGVLIVGAHRAARVIARALEDAGVPTLLVDMNRRNIHQANMEGLDTHYGNILEENIEEKLDLTRISRLMALTPNNSVNSLANLYFGRHWGADHVYQLSAQPDEDTRSEVAMDLQGQILFGTGVDYETLDQLIEGSGKIKTIQLSEQFTFKDLQGEYATLIPLFAITDEQTVQVFTDEVTLSISQDARLICLVEDRPDDR